MPVYTRSQLSRLSAVQSFLPLFRRSSPPSWRRRRQHHCVALVSSLALFPLREFFGYSLAPLTLSFSLFIVILFFLSPFFLSLSLDSLVCVCFLANGRRGFSLANLTSVVWDADLHGYWFSPRLLLRQARALDKFPEYLAPDRYKFPRAKSGCSCSKLRECARVPGIRINVVRVYLARGTHEGDVSGFANASAAMEEKK